MVRNEKRTVYSLEWFIKKRCFGSSTLTLETAYGRSDIAAYLLPSLLSNGEQIQLKL